jgi:hypothetical protein
VLLREGRLRNRVRRRNLQRLQASALRIGGLLQGLYFPEDAGWDNVDNLGGGNKWVPEISAQPHGRYLTIWVSKSGSTIKVQAINGLLIPRADGFWHAGRQIVKSAQYPESNYDEQFWAAPVGDKRKPPAEDPEADDRSARLITYVGPEHLSDTEHSLGGAGMSGGDARHHRTRGS